jgi:hypothetical protein
MQSEGLSMGNLLRRLVKQMLQNDKCCVGLLKDGRYVIPHEPDGWTDSVRCDRPVVALEKYADFDDTLLPVYANIVP